MLKIKRLLVLMLVVVTTMGMGQTAFHEYRNMQRWDGFYEEWTPLVTDMPSPVIVKITKGTDSFFVSFRMDESIYNYILEYDETGHTYSGQKYYSYSVFGEESYISCSRSMSDMANGFKSYIKIVYLDENFNVQGMLLYNDGDEAY